mgnify:CR=1 FL=1
MRCSLFPTIAVVLILLTRLANGDPIHTAVQQDNVKQILEILKDNPKAVNASNDQHQRGPQRAEPGTEVAGHHDIAQRRQAECKSPEKQMGDKINRSVGEHLQA